MMFRPLILMLVRRTARRRVQRLGGTAGTAWAVRIPLVTLVVATALLLVVGTRARD